MEQVDTSAIRNGRIFISYAREDGSEEAERLAETLGRRGFSTWIDVRAVEPLVSLLTNHTTHYSHLTIIDVLGDLGEPRAQEPLVQVLRGENKHVLPRIRLTLRFIKIFFLFLLAGIIAKLLLGAVGFLPAISIQPTVSMWITIGILSLVTWLVSKNRSQTEIKGAAAAALGKIGDEAAIPILVAALGESASMVYQIRGSLTKFRDNPAVVEELVKWKTSPRKVGLFRRRVRDLAYEVLMGINTFEAQDARAAWDEEEGDGSM